MPKTFKALFAEARKRDAYWAEWATSDFAAELIRRMEQCGINRRELAQKLQVSPAYITKALRGNENFTVRSLVKLARAVDSVIRVHLAPLGSHTVWYDVVEGLPSAMARAANKAERITFLAEAKGRRSTVQAIASAAPKSSGVTELKAVENA